MLKYINIFYSTLSTFYKNQIFLIFIMVLLSIFFDTLGIGMIVPIVGLLIDQSIVEKYPFFSSVLEFLGNPNEEKLLIYFVYFLYLSL